MLPDSRLMVRVTSAPSSSKTVTDEDGSTVNKGVVVWAVAMTAVRAATISSDAAVTPIMANLIVPTVPAQLACRNIMLDLFDQSLSMIVPVPTLSATRA